MESNTVPESVIKEGLRFDQGKLRMELIPPEPIRGLAEVLSFGARKYADRNWELGMDWSRCLGSLKRHLQEWEEGKQFDKETGLAHLDHIICNAVFLSTYEKRKIGTNDIPAYNVK